MRLDPFIADLLYDHDCVIVPDFGGLVANYRPARLNVISHVIQPPSKHVGFNARLKQNDGLLINYVASVLGISYKEATARVSETIEGYQLELHTNGRFMLDRIGVFFKDRAGQLQFIPDETENFLTASFGCKPVQLKPVFVEVTESSEAAKVVSMPNTSGKRKVWKVAAAIALPIMLAASFLAGNKVAEHGELSFASLNPFAEPPRLSSYAPGITAWNPNYAFTTEIAQLQFNDTLTEHFDFVSGLAATSGIKVTPAEREKIRPVSNEIAKPEANNKSRTTYAIIGGAFQVKENAERMVKQLRDQGYDASLAGMRDDLHLVSYGSYDVRGEAVADLRQIQANGGKAWIKTVH